MKDTLFEEIYSINKSVYASRRDPTRDERRTAVERKKDLFKYYAAQNPLVKKALTTESTFVSLHEGLKMKSLRRALFAGRIKKDENADRELEYLARVTPNVRHLARHGVLYPDNPTTNSAYGALAGAAGSLVYFGNINMGAIELGFAAGGMIGSCAAAVLRNKTMLDLTSSQDIAAPKPWHALQVLDLERAFYRGKDNLNWAFMEISPIDITRNMTGPERDTLSDNKLLLNEGITYFYRESTIFDRMMRIFGCHVNYDKEFSERAVA